MTRGYLTLFAALCLISAIGCDNQSSPFKRMENELNDLKVEVFRQRQELQTLVKKTEEDQRAAADERAKESRFRADTQEALRQIRESTQAMSNRLNTGSAPRPAVQPARPQTVNDSARLQANAALNPDEMQFAMAEKDFNAGNYSGAVDAADNLIKYFPDSDSVPEALYLKGRALFALKSYGKAQETFQTLCTDFPASDRFRVARLNIGKCQMEQNNKLAAVSTFEDIARRWPNSPEARSANELLQDIKANR